LGSDQQESTLKIYRRADIKGKRLKSAAAPQL